MFLSTLSLRRATYYGIYTDSEYFVSIHALLAESDPVTLPVRPCCPMFLSTLSLRRATQPAADPHRKSGVSIHALLAESDQRYSRASTV